MIQYKRTNKIVKLPIYNEKVYDDYLEKEYGNCTDYCCTTNMSLEEYKKYLIN